MSLPFRSTLKQMRLSSVIMMLCMSLFSPILADNEIYGSLRYDFQNSNKSQQDRPAFDTSFHPSDQKSGHYPNINRTGKSRKSNIGDAGSRIGIKGHHDIGEGNAIIYNLEWGFDGVSHSSDDSFYNREAWLGISGKMGSLKAGRQKNPFYEMINDNSVTDGFNSKSVIQSSAAQTMSTILMGR